MGVRRLSIRFHVPLTLWIGLAFGVPSASSQQIYETASNTAQFRVDSEEVSKRARDLQATFERRRRAMLPRFYVGQADHCLIVGRFCEWHPRLEDYVVPGEGKNIVRARAELLRNLEKLSDALPGDEWIAGQRIRYLVEGHDSSAISVARACRSTKWWCDALLGLALHVAGDFAAADSAFALALDGMSAGRRRFTFQA